MDYHFSEQDVMLTSSAIYPTGNTMGNETTENQSDNNANHDEQSLTLSTTVNVISMVEIMKNINDRTDNRISNSKNESLLNTNQFSIKSITDGTLYLSEPERSVTTTEEQTISELLRVSTTAQFENQKNRVHLALEIILRLVLPLANGIARSLKGVGRLRFLHLLKKITSSSVNVTYRIEPLLKMVKIYKNRIDDKIPVNTPAENLPFSLLFGESKYRNANTFSITPYLAIPHPRPTPVIELKAPKCVTIDIIAEPEPGTPIRADIVIIHGLHGSLKNTWKQGLWNNDRHPVNFKRPPPLPVRPPKRPRHSRSNIFHPPHKEKRARFVDQDHFEATNALFSYECPDEIRICDGIEYSFPTFRLRIEDHGLLLQDPNPEPELCEANVQKKSSTKDCNYSTCWPADWLPLDCPGVRVIAVNYTTDPYLWRPLWKKKEARSNLIERSREMAELLTQHKVGFGHPIVWVGHSKGGLFIKQIIVDAWESGRPAMEPLWRSSRGTFFYSVPHRGSHLASIKAPFLCRSVELLDVEKNSKYLLDLHRRFAGLYQMGHLKIEVFSFVETALTLMSVLFLRIVGVDSADPGIGDVCGIQLDHREICKPRSRDCILYKELVKMIKKVC